MITQEQFERLNPMICTTYGIMGYNSHEALLIQGAFLATRTFIFDTLDEMEANLLRLRYGVDNQNPMRYDEIAEKMNILGIEAVKKIEFKAVRKLRNPLRIKLLKNYTDDTIDRRLLERFLPQKSV